MISILIWTFLTLEGLRYFLFQSFHIFRFSDIYQCDKCKAMFSSAFYLVRHRTYVCAESSEFQCEKCSKIFRNIANFKRHERRGCELKKAFNCVICSAAFTQKANLKVHLKTHLNIREYQCPHCERYFSRNTFLKNHIMSVHEKEKPFVCSECGKTFSRMDSMKRHGALHKEREYSCNLCGMTYHTLNNLNMHTKRVHTDNQDMLEDKCRLCSKTFKDIKSHMFFIHQKKALEKCGICNKSFRNLGNHMRSHERVDGKKKECPICELSFVSLNGHMKKHANDKKHDGTQQNLSSLVRQGAMSVADDSSVESKASDSVSAPSEHTEDKVTEL